MAKKVISVITKTGDAGESGLASGQRLSKDSQVFEVLGDLDELNSWVGLVIALMPSELHKHSKFLKDIQDHLFQASAELAGSSKVKISSGWIGRLERHTQRLQQTMNDNWHSLFIYPGGSLPGAHLDLARAVCRRAERQIVKLGREQRVRPTVLAYINRLSDYLYVLRCAVNQHLEADESFFQAKR